MISLIIDFLLRKSTRFFGILLLVTFLATIALVLSLLDVDSSSTISLNITTIADDKPAIPPPLFINEILVRAFLFRIISEISRIDKNGTRNTEGYICKCKDLDSTIHVSCERNLGEAPYYLNGFKLRLDIIGRKNAQDHMVLNLILITVYVKISFGRRVLLSIKGSFSKIKMLQKLGYIPRTVEAELREDLYLEFREALSRICRIVIDKYTLVPSAVV